MYFLIPASSEEFQKSYFQRAKVRKDELMLFGFRKLSTAMQGATDVFYKKIGDQDFYFRENGDLCEKISVKAALNASENRSQIRMP